MEWNGVVVAVKMKVEKMLEPHPTALKMLEDHTAWPQLVVEPAVPAAHAQNALVKTPLHGLVVGEGAQAEPLNQDVKPLAKNPQVSAESSHAHWLDEVLRKPCHPISDNRTHVRIGSPYCCICPSDTACTRFSFEIPSTALKSNGPKACRSPWKTWMSCLLPWMAADPFEAEQQEARALQL